MTSRRPGSDPVVYVLVDEADRALYVGSTKDVARRVGEHRRRQPWWPDVARVEVYPMEAWDVALYVERNLISRLAPRHNVQCNSRVAVLMNEFFAPMQHELSEVLS